MAYYIHHSYSQSFLVTSEEEPDSGHTEHSNSSEHSAHKEVYWLGKDVKEYRKKPKPEVAKDMCHGIEQYG